MLCVKAETKLEVRAAQRLRRYWCAVARPVCAIGSRVEAQHNGENRQGARQSGSSWSKKDDAEDGGRRKDRAARLRLRRRRRKQYPVQPTARGRCRRQNLQSGKTQQAAQALTATLAGGNLPPAIMARALYMRGVAYRQWSKTGEGDFRSRRARLRAGSPPRHPGCAAALRCAARTPWRTAFGEAGIGVRTGALLQRILAILGGEPALEPQRARQIGDGLRRLASAAGRRCRDRAAPWP